MKTVFQSQLEDREALEGVLSLHNPTGSQEMPAASPGFEEAAMRLKAGKTNLEAPIAAEAIVMLHGYPSLLIQNGDYLEPESQTWRTRLSPYRDKIRHVIANTGRVDLVNHPDYKWVGTAWRVDTDVFITNRHVASIFAQARNGGFEIKRGIEAKVDLAEEHLSTAQMELFVNAILHIEDVGDSAIDMAVLRVDAAAIAGMGDPLQLSAGGADEGFIGVVGYPARDPRNPGDAMARIFGDIYNVKRLAPGRIMDFGQSANVFTHNCTTLGGNSGSVVFDIESGLAIGLHFAGSALTANYAAKADAIHRVLRKASVSVPAFQTRADPTGRRGASEAEAGTGTFEGRDGYRPDFLGTGPLAVPLPQLNPLQQQKVAKTESGETVLAYRHFSVVMNRKLRLAFFAAANIDGDTLRRPRRVSKFHLDPRLAETDQAGEELYASNPFDRGHLIRRLDPTWGDKADAEEANRDSMFFPNIAPQHKNLNQKIWLALEEHILDETDARDAKVSVFVGCVFGGCDPVHKPSGIKVPMAFWKLVVSRGRVRRGRGSETRLQAQAFMLFQDHLVSESDLEIVFGSGFETHQVTICALERITGLDFHVLRDADTFAMPPQERTRRLDEAVSATSPLAIVGDEMRPLGSLQDIVAG